MSHTQLDFSHLQTKKRSPSTNFENKENISHPFKFQTKELKVNLETESKSLFPQKQTQEEVIQSKETSGFAKGEIILNDTFIAITNEQEKINTFGQQEEIELLHSKELNKLEEKERLDNTEKFLTDELLCEVNKTNAYIQEIKQKISKSKLDNEEVNNLLFNTNTEKERSLEEMNRTNEERNISQRKKRISKLNSQKKELKVEIEELRQELSIRILFVITRSNKEISQELQQIRIENEQTINLLKLEINQKIKEYLETKKEGLELIKSFKGQIKSNSKNNEKDNTEKESIAVIISNKKY